MADGPWVFPASFEQRRLWLLHLLHPGDGVYNVPFAVSFPGPLDAGSLERALAALIRRHESLRTTFATVDGEPVQVVHHDFPVEVPFEDLSGFAVEERERRYEAAAARDLSRPFDLASGPLLRARLLRLDDEEHVLLVTAHHIVIDGWSTRIFERELRLLHDASSHGTRDPLPPPVLQYADFALWQRRRLTGPFLDDRLDWWKTTLRGAPAVSSLPADRRPASGEDVRGASIAFRLPASLCGQLQAFCAEARCTAFMATLATLAIVLGRYRRADDLVIGGPSLGRDRAGLESVIGFFVNTLPLRIRLDGDPSFRELVERVRTVVADALAHGEIPFDELVARVAPDRQSAHAPLVQVMFTCDTRDEPDAAPDSVGALEIDLPVPGTAKFELTLALTAGPRETDGVVEFRTDLFEPASIAWLIRHFAQCLREAVEQPGRPISALSLITPEEARLDILWNRTETPYPREASIAGLFDEVADRFADRIAVADGPRRLSYRTLRENADLVRRALDAIGLAPGAAVGLCADRSIESVVGTLGILRAGAAYVPLDPGYPAERVERMLDDSGARVVLAQAQFASRFARSRARVLSFEDVARTAPSEGVAARPDTKGDDVAYVMFTSGSTGSPKGVAITQRGVIRLARGADYCQVRPHDVVAHVSNTSFDAATFEIWAALLNGARLEIVPRDVALSPKDLAAHVRAAGVTVMFLTTPLFHQCGLHAAGDFGSLECLLFGGDFADPGIVRRILHSASPPRRVLHVYGPTEATTFATWHGIEALDARATNVPIGRPIANTTVHVLDPQGCLSPIGVPGEIFVGGDGLARGYVGGAARDAAFGHHAAPHVASERLYRTGDLARRREDGTIEFLGRSDDQVKIRGFRVEPRELEVILAHAPGVSQAVVLTRGSGANRELAAFVEGPVLDVQRLREYLRSRVPEFMMPSAIHVVSALPLTPNGKVDRVALAALPETRAEATPTSVVGPRTEYERMVADVWRQVLDHDRFGVHDNFFDVGGHSLLVVAALERLRSSSGLDLAVLDLFRYTTIADLAGALDERAAAKQAPGPQPVTLVAPALDSVGQRAARVRDWLTRARSDDDAAVAAGRE